MLKDLLSINSKERDQEFAIC